MIFQFEIVGYPIGDQGPWDGPKIKIIAIEAASLLEAYRIVKERGIAECGEECTIRLKENSAKRK